VSTVGRAKVAARRLTDRAGAGIGQVQLWWVGRAAGRRGVTVLDIDNTLADTWPSYLDDWPDHRSRLRGLVPLPGMRAAAYDTAIARGDVVIFLTHRNWWEWRLTLRWLRDEGYPVSVAHLVLVASPGDKIAHLQRLVGTGSPVTYWDDLSHGQESGRPQRYVEVVAAVESLRLESGRLEYHGVDEIEAIVAAAGGR
jgi:hypothetical protein